MISSPERPMKRRTGGLYHGAHAPKVTLTEDQVEEIHDAYIANPHTYLPKYSAQRIPVTKPIYVCEDKEACLYAHNKLRSYHSVETLAWDERLVKDSKNWAIYLLENDYFEHDSCYPDGENLYLMPSDPNWNRIYQAVQMFYEEIAKYNFEHPEIYETNEQAFKQIGHFSQIVWKETNKIGSCVAFDNASKKTIIVCRYNIGQSYDFSTQVPQQVVNDNGELFIPQCEDLIWENDVKPTLHRVDHYMM
ncbi:venom allergen 5 2-like [Hydractinia symbiolongicarpus]|uniref:venom allergen 5 2-like n=1 Tax=Hydractinia symbiolongicarpus TaxID=13093 RepID=UPI0025508510|nr:venom allergen 5 2-like [Hydractinia symbiolongicarpus]